MPAAFSKAIIEIVMNTVHCGFKTCDTNGIKHADFIAGMALYIALAFNDKRVSKEVFLEGMSDAWDALPQLGDCHVFDVPPKAKADA